MNSHQNKVIYKGNSFTRNLPTILYIVIILTIASTIVSDPEFNIVAISVFAISIIPYLFFLRKKLVIDGDNLIIQYAFRNKTIRISEIATIEWSGYYTHSMPVAVMLNGNKISLEPGFVGVSVFNLKSAIGVLSPLATYIDPHDKRNIETINSIQEQVFGEGKGLDTNRAVAAQFNQSLVENEIRAIKKSKIVHIGLIILALFWIFVIVGSQLL